MKSKYTKQKQQELLVKGLEYNLLSVKQAFTIIFWELFQRKKLEEFYDAIESGMHGLAAFNKVKDSHK